MDDGSIGTLPVLSSPLLASIDNVRHGFYTRNGGSSTGFYGSLNCSEGSLDDPVCIGKNRAKVADDLGVERLSLFSLRQVHGNRVVHPDQERPAVDCQGDALVSATNGIAVGVLTADCVPVLLADPVTRIVGAAHAGWKGACAGVIESVVKEMENRGARRKHLVAAIGPAIQRGTYEVGPERVDAVRETFEFDTGKFFTHRQHGHYFDLPGLVEALCLDAGISKLDNIGIDTYSCPDRLFSYRRSVHKGEPDYGRQIAAICLVCQHG